MFMYKLTNIDVNFVCVCGGGGGPQSVWKFAS